MAKAARSAQWQKYTNHCGYVGLSSPFPATNRRFGVRYNDDGRDGKDEDYVGQRYQRRATKGGGWKLEGDIMTAFQRPMVIVFCTLV